MTYAEPLPSNANVLRREHYTAKSASDSSGARQSPMLGAVCFQVGLALVHVAAAVKDAEPKQRRILEQIEAQLATIHSDLIHTTQND